METIDINATCQWLKSSITGIIVLGAVGSILAVIILKLAQLVFPKLLNVAFIKLFTPMMRRNLAAKIAADKLEQQSQSKAMANLIGLATSYFVFSILLTTFFSLSAIYFIVRGPTLGVGIFILTTCTFLSLYLWFNEAGAFFGALEVYEGKEVGLFEEAIRKKHHMNDLLRQEEAIDKRRKSNFKFPTVKKLRGQPSSMEKTTDIPTKPLDTDRG